MTQTEKCNEALRAVRLSGLALDQAKYNIAMARGGRRRKHVDSRVIEPKALTA